jgi:hypothetical protein
VHHRISSLQAVVEAAFLFCVRIVCGKRKAAQRTPLAGRLMIARGKEQAPSDKLG